MGFHTRFKKECNPATCCLQEINLKIIRNGWKWNKHVVGWDSKQQNNITILTSDNINKGRKPCWGW